MMAICSLKLDTHSNNRYSNVISHLDGLKEALSGFTIHNGPLHAIVYYCLLASEVYMVAASTRAYYEAGLYMLLAAPIVLRYPMLNALVVERSACYFLYSGNYRKYVLYELICGNKYQKCGEKGLLHSTVCYANIMLMVQDERWGDMIVYLLRKLSNQLQIHSVVDRDYQVGLGVGDGTTTGTIGAGASASGTTTQAQQIMALSPQRGLLLLLHVLQCSIDPVFVCGGQSDDDAVSVLLELMQAQGHGSGSGQNREPGAVDMDMGVGMGSDDYLYVGAEWNAKPEDDRAGAGEIRDSQLQLQLQPTRSSLSTALPDYLLGTIPLELRTSSTNNTNNTNTNTNTITDTDTNLNSIPSASASVMIVEDMSIPLIDRDATCLLTPINGNIQLLEHGTGFAFEPISQSQYRSDGYIQDSIDTSHQSESQSHQSQSHRSTSLCHASLYNQALLTAESLWGSPIIL